MSKIALFGATGMIGQRILNEAVARDHKVTAIIRDITKEPEAKKGVEFKPGDALKAESVALAVAGNEIVVSAYGPRGGDSDQIVTAAKALIEGVAAEAQPMRLIVVNGAGSLEVSPGMQLVDTPDFPKAWKALALAHRDALAVFQASHVDWTCISPAAFIEPGKRTGRYRTGLDQLVVDDRGESRISAEDFAVAVVDEIERRQFPRQRFTIAY
jgi:uncharacterized protein